MRIFLLWLIISILQISPSFALTLAGTGDSEVLLQRLASEYHLLYPGRSVEVPPSTGSSGGIRMLLQNRTDLARVARPLSETESRQGLHWLPFARVPIVFTANLPNNCLSDLKSEQLLNIFNGRYKRWSQLGACPDQKIFLARREYDDSSNRILYEQISGLRDLKNPAGKTIYTTVEAFNTISAHPYTLGYLPLSQITQPSLTQFSIDGVIPGPGTILDNSYKFQLPLALVWKDSLSEESRKFLRFLVSAEAQDLIRQYGAVPVSGQGF